MSDYQALIENIRGFLASTFQVKSDEVGVWAEQYSRLCREANERLRQCADYLKKKLRVEAIHTAEASPNLLDLVAALDIPELPEWKEICFRFELPDAPALMLETAATLNEAYAQEQPMEGLAAYHRLLALARAPLKNRLAVMRKLELMDLTTAVLEDDIRTFERLRLEEIRLAVPMLARANDVEGVNRVAEELSERWRITVPADLRRTVDDLAGKFHRSSTEVELRRLMPALNDAYSAMSFEETGTLVRQLLAVAAQAGMALPEDIADQVAAINNWLIDTQTRFEQEAAFTQACDALQQAIDTDAPTPRLDQAYREAVAFGLELSPHLEGRYRKTLHDRIAAIRNKRLMTIIGIAAAFLVIAGVVTFLIIRSMRQQETADALAVIEQQTSDASNGDVKHVREVVQQVLDQHPRVASDAQIIAAMEKFKAACATEEARKAEADKLEAEKKIADKNRLDAIRLASQIEAQFTAEVSALEAKIESDLTPAVLAGNPDLFEKRIGGFNEDIARLSEKPNVSLNVRNGAKVTLGQALKKKQEMLDDAKAEIALVDQVVQAATADAKGAAINAYLAKFNSTDKYYLTEFTKAAQRIPAEHSLEVWGQMTARWNGQLLPATYDAAKARVGELQAYLTDNPASPLAKAIADYIGYLTVGLDVAGPNGPWKGGDKYSGTLHLTVVHDLNVLLTTDGKRYYVDGDPKLKVSGGSIEFSAVLSSEEGKRDKVTLAAPVGLKKPLPEPSPQARYAATVLARLDALDFAGWETAGTAALADLQKSPDMDTVLKAILVKKAIESNASLSDWVGEKSLKGVADALGGQNIDDVEWLNPNNPPRPDLIVRLRKIMDDLPPMIKTLDDAVRQRRVEILGALKVGLAASGIAMRDEKHNLILKMRGTWPEGTPAYAVGAGGMLVQIGHRNSKDPTGWTVEVAQALDVPAGSLVFVVTK